MPTMLIGSIDKWLSIDPLMEVGFEKGVRNLGDFDFIAR